jgi:hypothetical protein
MTERAEAKKEEDMVRKTPGDPAALALVCFAWGRQVKYEGKHIAAKERVSMPGSERVHASTARQNPKKIHRSTGLVGH